MALASLSDLLTKMASPSQVKQWLRFISMPGGTGWGSLWSTGTGLPLGATPGAAAVCDRATVGALGQENGGGELRAWISAHAQGAAVGTLMVYDRLVHMGGLSGTVTTPQAVSTSALTRYTSGVGVMAVAEIYTTIGTTLTTITMDYTDQDGNAGITSQPVGIGSTNIREAARVVPMSLALGDTGVRAVNTVTLLASTGTAGNFGVTLIKPLFIIPLSAPQGFPMKAHPITAMGMNLPEILDDACLGLMLMAGGTSTTLATHLSFLET